MYGLYVWEWIMTIDFDLQFIMGYRKFRWPLVRATALLALISSPNLSMQITYFYGRYAMLVGLTGFIVAVNNKKCVAALLTLLSSF